MTLAEHLYTLAAALKDVTMELTWINKLRIAAVTTVGVVVIGILAWPLAAVKKPLAGIPLSVPPWATTRPAAASIDSCACAARPWRDAVARGGERGVVASD